LLPVVCDVSGLTEVTQKPTALNSGLVVTGVPYQINDRALYISIAMNIPLASSRTSRCGDVAIAGTIKGRYNVFYLEPNKTTHAIGVVDFLD
jgi:hypothetical protein